MVETRWDVFWRCSRRHICECYVLTHGRVSAGQSQRLHNRANQHQRNMIGTQLLKVVKYKCYQIILTVMQKCTAHLFYIGRSVNHPISQTSRGLELASQIAYPLYERKPLIVIMHHVNPVPRKLSYADKTIIKFSIILYIWG